MKIPRLAYFQKRCSKIFPKNHITFEMDSKTNYCYSPLLFSRPIITHRFDINYAVVVVDFFLLVVEWARRFQKTNFHINHAYHAKTIDIPSNLWLGKSEFLKAFPNPLWIADIFFEICLCAPRFVLCRKLWLESDRLGLTPSICSSLKLPGLSLNRNKMSLSIETDKLTRL